MQAMVYTRYGPPSVLRLREVPKPSPRDNEVLVRVHAASVNSWDWDLVTGRPIAFRMWGFFKPKYRILGADIAGRVAGIGRGVSRFRVGDEVFGDLCASGWGGFAEYVCADEAVLTRKPSGVSFEEAAAIPQAAVMAWQAVRDRGTALRGRRVLINGAGGGVGTFAIQMAKTAGAEVTAVDGAEKFDTMREAGADYLIDYRNEDYTASRRRYDLIIDSVARRSILDYQRALRSGGACIVIGGGVGTILQFILLGPSLSLLGSKTLRILAHEPNKELANLAELVGAGKIAPVIDRRYPLVELPAALQYLADGRALGKVIITI